MEFSKLTKAIALTIADSCATFEPCEKFYYIQNLDSIPDCDLSELCSSIMADDPARASEATGPDNPEFEKSMLPAMLTHLQNSTDKDDMHFFVETWQKGIIEYLKPCINTLLEDALYELNHDDYESRNDEGFNQVQISLEDRTWAA